MILFLLGFCANQLHIIEPISDFYFQYHSKINIDSINDTPEGEEDGSEKEEIGKEMEYFIVINYAGHLSNLLNTESNRTIRFSSLFYTNPYSQKDIKPPRCA